MDMDLLSTFDYALKNSDRAVIDSLAEKFETFPDDEREIMICRSVIYSKDIDFLEYCLKKFNVPMDYTDSNKATLLHLAALSFDDKAVKYFLGKGLDIEAQDMKKNTPLGVGAIEGRSLEPVKALLEAGANINAPTNRDENMLISAAGRNAYLEMTKFFLEKGFDIEGRDGDGYTPILNAARWQENVDVIEYLVSNGANYKARTKTGENIMHLAARNPVRAVARYVRASFFVTDCDNDNNTVLDVALQEADNVDVLDIYLFKLREEMIFKACFNRNPEILAHLIKLGYDPNTRDSDGMTALMFAARVNSNPLIINMLRYYNAIYDLKDDEGRNLLHYAAANSDPAIYEFCLTDDELKTLAAVEDAKGKLPEFYKENPNEF